MLFLRCRSTLSNAAKIYFFLVILANHKKMPIANPNTSQYDVTTVLRPILAMRVELTYDLPLARKGCP